ncbi:hypothetical protein AB0883_14820 [Micromonospora sp. NPDC047812]|uniref:hypothetical protein n=1 Tax=Micromonospora sp. NPDC047812 TaxID=3155742 RepID=UPI0034526EA9
MAGAWTETSAATGAGVSVAGAAFFAGVASFGGVAFRAGSVLAAGVAFFAGVALFAGVAFRAVVVFRAGVPFVAAGGTAPSAVPGPVAFAAVPGSVACAAVGVSARSVASTAVAGRAGVAFFATALFPGTPRAGVALPPEVCVSGAGRPVGDLLAAGDFGAAPEVSAPRTGGSAAVADPG